MPAANSYFFKVEGPLLAPPPYGTMKACGFFDGIETLIRRRGGSFEQVVERHGIDPSEARDPDYAIRCTSAAAILEFCSRAFDDRLFGLRLGESLQAEVYGALTTYARVAPDLRQAIGVLLEYMPVTYCPGAEVEFCIGGEVAEFRWRPYREFACDEQANYYGQSQVVRFLEGLIGTEFRPDVVQVVSRPTRKDVEGMERFFGCKVLGSAPSNIVAFRAGLLDNRNSAANPLLFGLLGNYFAQVRKAAQGSFVDAVRAYARTTLATGHCTIERCAAKLELSARTVQRRLLEEDLRFSQIVEEERMQAARRALTQTADSLSEIAFNLGYSDQSSFGRAFKRWTGQTPQVFRETAGLVPICIAPVADC
jgi:AraC-like DNA-binding protein